MKTDYYIIKAVHDDFRIQLFYRARAAEYIRDDLRFYKDWKYRTRIVLRNELYNE